MATSPLRRNFNGTLVAGLAAVLMAGCASRAPIVADGPDPHPPPGLDRVPDAVPRIEPLRVGGPNKPYEVFGQRYVPVVGDEPLVQSGLASWYGRKFHGRPTSSGEIYDMHAMSAAHKTMPIPSYARVRNPANGREVVVRVNDRGPFADGRIIDLSYAAALRLGVLRGVAPVQVERLTFAQINAGVGAPASVAVVAAVAPDGAATASAVTEAATVGAPIEWVQPVPIAVAASTAVPVPGAVAVPAAAVKPVVSVAAVQPAQPDPESGPAAMPLPVLSAAAASVVALPTAESPPAATPADGPVLSGWWLQLGAFRQRAGAQQLQQRAQRQVDDLPAVAIFEADALYRVQVGPYASPERAQDAALQLQQRSGIAPLLVERGAGGRPLAAR